MKNIILKKEWLTILSNKSKALRNEVMSAIFDYIESGNEPDNLSPEAEISFQLIKSEMIALDASLDFDGALEAAIRKKRVRQRREAKAAEANNAANVEKEQNRKAGIITIEKHRSNNITPLPQSGNVPLRHIGEYDYYNYQQFETFYNLFPSQKDDLLLEYSRFRHQFSYTDNIVERLADSIRTQMAWHEKMESKGYNIPPFPNLQTWITNECWRDKLPDLV